MAFIDGTEFNDNDTTQFNGTNSQFFPSLIGTSNDDAIRGLGGNDILNGGDGKDELVGGTGADIMIGGNGSDNYEVDNLNDITIESTDDVLGGNNDYVISSISFTLKFGFEGLQLLGTASLDGTGNAKDNFIFGNSAANRLDGGAGADMMIGYDGDDTYIIDNPGDIISDFNPNNGSFDAGNDTVLSSIAYTLGIDLENLTLTGIDAINGTGNEKNNLLNGNSAANTLDGGLGADTMNGGNGNDTYLVDDSGDIAAESFNNVSAGNDTVLSSVTHALGFGMENLTLTGVSAINGTGNGNNNIITGNEAANILNGGTGADSMVGGDGNDTYFIDNSADMAIEAFEDPVAGIDTVNASVTFGLSFGINNLNLTGTLAINGTGNELNNTINGNGAANILDGGDGDDTLSSKSGNDNLNGGNGNDKLNGGAGVDAMIGGLGDDIYTVDNASDTVTEATGAGIDLVNASASFTLNSDVDNLTLTGTTAINGTGNTLANILRGNNAANTLVGAAGNDNLSGNGGNDNLLGGDGNDTLAGGLGNDNLDSGTGSDKFLFNTALGAANIDSITGYNAPTDTIQLENAIFTKFTATGAILPGNFKADAGVAATDANDFLLYNTTTGNLSYDADGNGAGAPIQFASLTGAPILTAAEFVIT